MRSALAAVAAARISSGADMVSIQTTSTPPSFKPSICSAKAATASSSESGPSGARRSPVGPTEPATATDRPPCLIRLLARDFGGATIEFAHAILQRMQHEPAAIGAEAVGQDDVGARIDEIAMERGHAIRMGLVPQFRALAGGKAHGEKVRPRSAVGEERPARGEHFVQHWFPQSLFFEYCAPTGERLYPDDQPGRGLKNLRAASDLGA